MRLVEKVVLVIKSSRYLVRLYRILMKYLKSLMMEAESTSETSDHNYFTWQYIPEDNSELHTRRRENLKSHMAPFAARTRCIHQARGQTLWCSIHESCLY
jgi:hypothetical protein